ncbi:hypothetical protein [Myxococcus vastator]|uniref:hypothetical protein n=1 Tax=Myxococcus vastator TaxID=2709664 RepID=UPI0013D45A09|nr:hypothetical protein [Myxococcus vastator]
MKLAPEVATFIAVRRACAALRQPTPSLLQLSPENEALVREQQNALIDLLSSLYPVPAPQPFRLLAEVRLRQVSLPLPPADVRSSL